MPYRLMVVDDHKCIRDMVRLLCQVKSNDEFVIAGEAWDANTALGLCREARPDIILLDIYLRDRCGLAVGEQMRSLIPAAKIVFFTCSEEGTFMKEALRIGAAGYLLKSNTDLTSLPHILKQIAEGRTVYPASLKDLLRGVGTGELSADQVKALTLKASGGTSKDVAQALNKSERAIEKILVSACGKLGVKNATHAVYVLTKRGTI